jgi:hypothetical protein
MGGRSTRRSPAAVSARRRAVGGAGWSSCRLALTACVALAGCATYHSGPLEVGRMKPKLQLSGADFRLVRRVTGEAETPFLFWIDIPDSIQKAAFENLANPIPVLTIALGDPRLRERAMAALHHQHDLRGKPQLLHNVVEEWSVANYLGLYAVLRVSISADVIELTRSPTP